MSNDKEPRKGTTKLQRMLSNPRENEEDRIKLIESAEKGTIPFSAEEEVRLTRLLREVYLQFTRGTHSIEEFAEPLTDVLKAGKCDHDLVFARRALKELEGNHLDHARACCVLYGVTKERYLDSAIEMQKDLKGDGPIDILIEMYRAQAPVVLLQRMFSEQNRHKVDFEDGHLMIGFIRLLNGLGQWYLGMKQDILHRAKHPWIAEINVAMGLGTMSRVGQDSIAFAYEEAKKMVETMSIQADKHILLIVCLLAENQELVLAQRFRELINKDLASAYYADTLMFTASGNNVLRKKAIQSWHNLGTASIRARAAAEMYEVTGEEDKLDYAVNKWSRHRSGMEGAPDLLNLDEQALAIIKGLAVHGKITEARLLANQLTWPRVQVPAYAAIYAARKKVESK